MIALIIYLIGVIIAIIFPIRHLTTKYNINLLQLVVILIYSLGSWATFFVSAVVFYQDIIIFKKRDKK